MSRGRLLGAVAEVDLLRYLAAGEHSLDTRVDALMESDYATVSPQTRIDLLQTLLADTRMAIVLDGDDLVGVVTKIDLITYLARSTARPRTPRRARKRRST